MEITETPNCRSCPYPTTVRSPGAKQGEGDFVVEGISKAETDLPYPDKLVILSTLMTNIEKPGVSDRNDVLAVLVGGNVAIVAGAGFVRYEWVKSQKQDRGGFSLWQKS